MNFDDFSLEDLRGSMAQGQVPEPKAAAAAPAPAVEEPPAEPMPAVAEPAKTDEPAAPAEPAPAPEVPAFQFTDGADLETFRQESQAYLETVEVTPELQQILDRQAQEIERLSTAQPADAAPQMDEFSRAVADAFNQLARYRRTEAGFVPDTTALTQVLQENFRNELPQIVMDVVSLPSAKYPGHTMFQEFLREYGRLDDQGMRSLDQFLSTGGKMATPSYVPEGIDSRYAEAFWQAPNRAEIEDTLAALAVQLNDPFASDETKADTRSKILGVNRQLEMIQRGIDAQKAAETQVRQSEQAFRTRIEQQAEKGYIGTATQMLDAFTEKLSETLKGTFDENGATATAAGMTTLVQMALNDDDWSRFAQDKLAKLGVQFDWKKGRQTLDRLYTVESQIAELELSSGVRYVNPRSIEIAKQEKANILRELKGLQMDAVGRVAKVAVNGAAKALETKVQNAPKVQAVRPRAQGAAPAGVDGPQVDFSAMSLDEIRARYGELQHEMRKHGFMPQY